MQTHAVSCCKLQAASFSVEGASLACGMNEALNSIHSTGVIKQANNVRERGEKGGLGAWQLVKIACGNAIPKDYKCHVHLQIEPDGRQLVVV